MTIRFTALLALIAGLALGCSSSPPLKSDPVDVTLTVVGPTGQPVKDVILNCFPTNSNQSPGGGKLDANGKVATKLITGKYTFGFEGQPAGMKAIPAKYHQNDAANSFEVTGPGNIELKLTN